MRQKHLGALSVLLTLILVGGTLIWWVNSRINEDPLWFLRTFKPEADWIVIYWEGKPHLLLPGDSGYDRIMDAFADGIGHWAGYEGEIELSGAELEAYRTQGCFLELHYDRCVQVHTRHPYAEATTFFVPLRGAHAESCQVFAGSSDTPRAGALTMAQAQFDALNSAIESSLAVHHAKEP